MVIMYATRIILPRFIASPILLGTSLVTRFKTRAPLKECFLAIEFASN